MRPRESSGEFRGLPKLFDKGIDLRSSLYSEGPIEVNPGGIEVSSRNLLSWAVNLLFNANSWQDWYLKEISNNHN